MVQVGLLFYRFNSSETREKSKVDVYPCLKRLSFLSVHQNLFGSDDGGDIPMPEEAPLTPGRTIRPNTPKTAARLAYVQVRNTEPDV